MYRPNMQSCRRITVITSTKVHHIIKGRQSRQLPPSLRRGSRTNSYHGSTIYAVEGRLHQSFRYVAGGTTTLYFVVHLPGSVNSA